MLLDTSSLTSRVASSNTARGSPKLPRACRTFETSSGAGWTASSKCRSHPEVRDRSWPPTVPTSPVRRHSHVRAGATGEAFGWLKGTETPDHPLGSPARTIGPPSRAPWNRAHSLSLQQGKYEVMCFAIVARRGLRAGFPREQHKQRAVGVENPDS